MEALSGTLFLTERTTGVVCGCRLFRSLHPKSTEPSNKPNQTVRAVSNGVAWGWHRERRKALKVARELTCLYKLGADTAIFHTREASDKFSPALFHSLFQPSTSTSRFLCHPPKRFSPPRRSRIPFFPRIVYRRR